MAIIAGVTVNWQLSPRVITIPSAEIEINIEDLQDTLLDLEDNVEGILWTTLRETSGGEDLGGGVFVGWTMELQNAVIAPAPRLTSVSSGTATSANPLGTVLTDSGATFISDGVEAGATILNSTDGSVTSVISVDSETQLTHYNLDDGTDNDWDMSDAYKVWNEIQFSVGGGNLVAVDGVGTTISPIRSTFGNEVLKTSSSSATFVQQETLQYSSFGNGVTVDIAAGFSGTEYPIGTPEFPSNNMPEAHTIAENRGFVTFFVISDLILSSEDFSAGHVFEGRSISSVTITINPGADVTNCEFRNTTILGTLDGGNTLFQCSISDLSDVNGIISGCILNAGTITLGGTTAYLLDCFSGVPGSSTPIINMGGSGQALAIRNYNGGVKITNKTGAEPVSMDLNSGQVILDSTVTNGEVIVRGIGKLTDNSVGATVNKDDLLNRESLTEPNWDTVWVDDSVGTAGTAFPLGTASNPTDNLVDAKIIADRIGIKQIRVRGSFTLADDFSGYEFFSHNVSATTIDINNQLTTDTEFEKVTIAGQHNPSSFTRFDDCDISDGVTDMQGSFHNCSLLGNFTVATGVLKQTLFYNCTAGGTNGVIIHAQPSVLIVGVGLAGTWTIEDVVTGPPPTIVQLEFNTGKITLDASCIGGVVTLAGVVDVVDSSGVACVVTRDAQMQTSRVVDSIWDEATVDHEADGSFGDHIRRIRNNKV